MIWEDIPDNYMKATYIHHHFLLYFLNLNNILKTTSTKDCIQMVITGTNYI